MLGHPYLALQVIVLMFLYLLHLSIIGLKPQGIIKLNYSVSGLESQGLHLSSWKSRIRTYAGFPSDLQSALFDLLSIFQWRLLYSIVFLATFKLKTLTSEICGFYIFNFDGSKLVSNLRMYLAAATALPIGS